MAKRILIVEDNPSTRNLLTLLLEGEGFETIQAKNGQDALEKVRNEFPDLVLLDVMLSGMDGYDVCHELKNDNFTRLIPLVIITNSEGIPEKANALDSFADDYITKPFRNQELIFRINSRLRTKALEEEILVSNKSLLTTQRAIQATTRELDKTRQDTIYSLLVALETRDPYTSGHAKKVSKMCVDVARAMDFDEKSLEYMEYASILHDVGKIGVPYNILMKEGKLSPEEEREMRKHPLISAEIIRPIGFLERIIPIIRSHHESFDGSGYPDGLKGDQIPMEARIISIVDAYHAMVSDRPYRRAMPVSRSINILQSVSGTQIDPDVLKIFFDLLEAENIEAALAEQKQSTAS